MAAIKKFRFTFCTNKSSIQSCFIEASDFFEAVQDFKDWLYNEDIPRRSIEDVEVTEIRR